MREIGSGREGLPPGTALIAGDLVQRQVLLRAGPGDALVYAASWWCAATVDRYLQVRGGGWGGGWRSVGRGGGGGGAGEQGGAGGSHRPGCASSSEGCPSPCKRAEAASSFLS
jgi:hypothetical protein